ncbi:hypothetical protein [Clostridium sp.]|uniref:hypothetical protein n=1 Tax=Clostridium sp. TaxID=1506 RepID=UPI00290C5009|nr:hypothetical protein [Clostridium sp.]MDU7363907.1 hypothetical protein [Clostridium sp.]
MNDLLNRFRKIYEEGTGLKVSWSKVDKDNNLTVGIVNGEGKEVFWLNVKEIDNEIVWW